MADRHFEIGVPTTWRELVQREQPLAEQMLESLTARPQDLAETKPPWLIADGLGGPAETIALAATLLGPATCLPYIEPIAPFLAHAISELEAVQIRDKVVPALGTLCYMNSTRCCGSIVPPEAVEAEINWLPRFGTNVKRLTTRERHTLGFIALATRYVDLVPVFVGGGRLPRKFEAGRVFQFNVPGLIRYLAAGLEQGAGAKDVIPAWHDFVEVFPLKRAAGTLDFVDLMWCARAVAVQFAGEPIATIGQMLHEMVT